MKCAMSKRESNVRSLRVVNEGGRIIVFAIRRLPGTVRRCLGVFSVTIAILWTGSFPVNAAEKESLSVPETAYTEETPEAQVIGIGMYEVQPGDSLWKIAQKLWGDGKRYSQLFAQNRDVLNDPDCVRPGQTLAYFREGETADHALVWEEPLMEQVVRRALIEIEKMDEEEQAQFMERPVMARDMEAVTSIWFSRKNNADTTYKPRLRFRINGYEEMVDLEVGQQFSYADLVHFTALKEIALGIDLPDYSFLSSMPRLEAIDITSGKRVESLNFLRGRTNLESLVLDGGGFGGVTDVSVLKNCKEMWYLWLDTPKLTDFSFLTDCAKIKQFTFYGLAQPDFALLPEAEYVRLQWVQYHRNEEGKLVPGKGQSVQKRKYILGLTSVKSSEKKYGTVREKIGPINVCTEG